MAEQHIEAEREQKVTPLELFFDLVFVFAITQVTALMADEPTWAGLARGMLVLAALWWAWAAYAWLTNTIDPEEGARAARDARRDGRDARRRRWPCPGAFGDDGARCSRVAYTRRCGCCTSSLYVLAARSDRERARRDRAAGAGARSLCRCC